MRSGNPTLRNETFTQVAPIGSTEVMTIQGTVNKTFVLLLLVLFTASLVWRDPVSMLPWLGIGAIGGFITAMVTVFKKQWAPVSAPIYALLEGLVLGGISALFERSYPGIVMQAVALTFGTLAALLIAYKSRLIQATENFKLGVFAATGGIFLVYLVSWIMSFFGASIPMIHQSGALGIGFSVFVVIIAALNLVIDFDFIEKGAESGAPRYMEWYGAFGLMVTLIWLYLEILRLLAKLRER
ncbi:MAG: Bax inhibitor-1/YccA family protein [Candidatus Omnitrophica bacterium]|nr:Bax inhibitor-1/YccA family protein [Candidatus Omnitrophota bacterium]